MSRRWRDTLRSRAFWIGFWEGFYGQDISNVRTRSDSTTLPSMERRQAEQAANRAEVKPNREKKL